MYIFAKPSRDEGKDSDDDPFTDLDEADIDDCDASVNLMVKSKRHQLGSVTTSKLLPRAGSSLNVIANFIALSPGVHHLKHCQFHDTHAQYT